MKRIFNIAFCISFIFCSAQSKTKRQFAAIGFWNVENLYDTLDDPLKNDEEFTPAGPNHWDTKKYLQKIDRLSEVISLMAADETRHGLSLLGLCEIENGHVLKDLVNSPRLKDRHYQYVLKEGPDARGVDPALIYDPKQFKVLHVLSYHVKLPSDTSHKTRDVLMVKGTFHDETLVVLVNHWPSRRGGESSSRPNRLAAATTVRRICDSIAGADPSIKIMVMGDFNDDPVDKSIRLIEGKNADLFNPMEQPYKKGIGTLAWRDTWNLFDQILVNTPFLSKTGKSWDYQDVRIFNKAFLQSDQGNFKGYPFRSFSSGVYTGGYSDHFPVYIILSREM